MSHLDSDPACMRDRRKTQEDCKEDPMGLSRSAFITLGRPRLIVDREKVSRLKSEGLSVRAIATKLQLSKSSVHNLLTVSARL